MTGRRIDIAIVGGGLAGGLTALAIHRTHPDLSLAVFEAGDCFGGNHRWSWFRNDIGDTARGLLVGFDKTDWTGGYDVRFPAHSRRLTSTYRSMASRDFDAHLRRELPQEAIMLGRRVAGMRADGIVLEDGTGIEAGAVIDCRDFEPTPHLRGGWQVFMGRHIRTPAPHGVAHPIVMDADVTQHDAYRFVYTLPLSDTELFVEDTYYADAPSLDREVLSARIDAYCASQGWKGQTIGSETGVLPVITGGDFTAYRRSLGPAGVVRAGARGGFVHPLTSYTLPFAAANAIAIANDARLPGPELAAMMEKRAKEHWRAMSFYRHLGRMLFLGAAPEQRFRIFERFYTLREPLIERLYSGRSTLRDKVRILTGKPPIPIHDGLIALLGKGAPLRHGSNP